METEMPYNDDYKIYNQNALILGYDYFQGTWGFGYGYMRMYYNKFSVAPHVKNETRVTRIGARFMHLNQEWGTIDKAFNLLTRLGIDIGFTPAKKRKAYYLFVGTSLNYLLYNPELNVDAFRIKSAIVSTGQVGGLGSRFWPGYSIGLQLLVFHVNLFSPYLLR